MAKNERQATEEELWEALNEPHCDGDFAKKLALAIIRANPSSSPKTDNQRMNTALRALLGDCYVPDKNYSAVRPALRWMADQYIRDRGGPGVLLLSRDPYAWLDRDPPGARTVQDLAQAASSAIENAPSAEYLETEFGKRRRPICVSEMEGSEIVGSLHLQALKQVAKILEPIGIRMDVDSI